MQANEGVEASYVLLGDANDDDYMLFAVTVAEMPHGIKLSRAENGVLLMQVLEKNIPDMLFLDLLLPVKNGVQCIKEIRRNPRYDSLPVIVYTARRDPADIQTAYRESANFFVIKPGTSKELRVILEKLFAFDWKRTVYFPPIGAFLLEG